jgi:hypothetical protein
MERPIRCLIYGGTSSLVAPLLRTAPFHYHFTLYTREENKSKQAPYNYLQYCQTLCSTTTTIRFYQNAFTDFPPLENIDRVIVFTTNPDVGLLTYLQQKNVPTLFIGSGSVTDVCAGRAQWSEYSVNKAWPEKFCTTTFRCGFFIPDAQEGLPAPPAGIGMDSARKIWSETVPDGEWLKREMYVTPVSFVIKNTLDWCIRDNLERWYYTHHIGTSCPLSRAYLRSLDPRLTMPNNWTHDMIKSTYEKEYNASRAIGLQCPTMMDHIPAACQRASAWIKSLN